MTETRQLLQSEWQGYFERVAKGLGTRAVQIEVTALDLGDQIEASCFGLTQLADIPKDDLLQVGTDQLTHSIHHPVEVWVVEGADGLESIQVKREDGVLEIIRLETPLLLPAPDAAAGGG